MTAPDAGHGPRLTDVQRRFLRAVVDRLGAERVAEVHLFPPMRQGHLESGVAVVAVLPEDAPHDGAASDGAGGAAPLETADLAPDPNHELALGAEAAPPDSLGSALAGDRGASSALAEMVAEPTAREVADATADPTADVAPGGAAPVEDVPDTEGPQRGRRVGQPRRLTIFSASYRLTLKGPDRGTWETEVRAEADAPLITVDAVVRGMQRRSAEAADPERLTGDSLRALLAPGE